MNFEISLLSLVSFLFDRLCFVFVLRVKTDDLSLSLYFNANENRVDERNEEKEDVAQWENDWDDTEETDDFKTH